MVSTAAATDRNLTKKFDEISLALKTLKASFHRFLVVLTCFWRQKPAALHASSPQTAPFSRSSRMKALDRSSKHRDLLILPCLPVDLAYRYAPRACACSNKRVSRSSELSGRTCPAIETSTWINTPPPWKGQPGTRSQH